jgi:Outer membrane protein beta-barrel domain
MDRFLSLNPLDVYGPSTMPGASLSASQPGSTVPRGFPVLTRVLVFIALLSGASMLHAQASPTASRAGDLKIGGGFTNVGGFKDACTLNNSEGLTIFCGSTTNGTNNIPNRVNGGMGYINYDFKPHYGIEGNFHFAKDGSSDVYQKTYEVGGRYYRTYGKWVPYGKVLYGRGVFNFAVNGTTYANLAYNLIAGGAGVDYKLRHYVYIRGDFEYQNWFSFPQTSLKPTLITVGAAYHF